MRVTIHPSKVHGTITAPPSKSMAHRLLICAGLSGGESVVRNLAFSKDVEATIACLKALGAQIELDGNTAYIKGVDVRQPLDNTAVLPCNECGSTLRFLIPLCLLCGEKRVLTGSEYLLKRPLGIYEAIAEKQGLQFEKSSDRLTVSGQLHSGVYEIAGNISSQFISGLLFALPLLDGDSEIRLIPPVESKPYIDMTPSALRDFGISVAENGNSYFIKGGQSYHPADITVEGDYSNAAFFEALRYADSDVTVDGLRADSLQGDRVYKILFKKIKIGDAVIDIADCPDLGPILFAVAALCGGAKFTGTRRLRIKESDRAAAMQAELKKLGIRMTVGENDATVHSGALHAPSEPLDGHNDHRIVMALSVLLTVTGGTITGAQAVSKSFPDYFDRLKDLGVDLIYGMDQ
ncbi:MAG: 3-phosphoshikimate 1-carboxyvinyltransferase [Ruminococcus sp.]|nr:3-phosphoshikimate 1-carboxyvinyltransferase [Ruminococcus sp.]